MKYRLVNCEIKEDANGKPFLSTRATSGESNDNGFSLPMFNPEFIAAAKTAVQNDRNVDTDLNQYFQERGAIIDKRTAPLGAVYFRRKEVNGQLTNEPVIDSKTGKPALYKSLDVHVIYTCPTEPAYDPATGIILNETVYINGVANTRPKMKFVLDEITGKPKKDYWKGWSLEERRDQILSAFYIVAPAEYQAISGPETPPVQQPAPAQAGNPFMNANVAPEQPAQQSQQGQVTDPLG